MKIAGRVNDLDGRCRTIVDHRPSVYEDISRACIMHIVHLPDLDCIRGKYYRYGNINAKR